MQYPADLDPDCERLHDLNDKGWAVFEPDTAAGPVANLKAIKRNVKTPSGTSIYGGQLPSLRGAGRQIVWR